MGIGSGRATSEVGGRFAGDGFFPTADLRHCIDGMSYTACKCEAVSFPEITDSSGVDIVDHREFSAGEESNVLGSTGVPINAYKRDLPFEAIELSFSSYHSGGVNTGFVDGHVDFITESISADVWSALGTQAGQETSVYSYQQ